MCIIALKGKRARYQFLQVWPWQQEASPASLKYSLAFISDLVIRAIVASTGKLDVVI